MLIITLKHHQEPVLRRCNLLLVNYHNYISSFKITTEASADPIST